MYLYTHTWNILIFTYCKLNTYNFPCKYRFNITILIIRYKCIIIKYSDRSLISDGRFICSLTDVFYGNKGSLTFGSILQREKSCRNIMGLHFYNGTSFLVSSSSSSSIHCETIHVLESVKNIYAFPFFPNSILDSCKSNTKAK